MGATENVGDRADHEGAGGLVATLVYMDKNFPTPSVQVERPTWSLTNKLDVIKL
jgi:hypothetical protein